MGTLLTSQDIQAKIAQLDGWQQSGDTIEKQYKFKNFIEAIAFVDKIVAPAEAADHHPDITISYNKVTINLTTHDAGGLTQKDFDLAATLDQL